MSFTVTTEPREDRLLAVKIEVSQDRVDRELRKAAAKVAGQYRIPGFRRGKAPYHIVVQQFGLANLYNEFVEDLGQDLFRQAIEQEKIEPYAQSSLENIEMDPLRYTLVVPLDPEVKLGDYHSLRLEEVKPTVDAAEVERRLEAYREQYSSWQDVDRPSAYGDTLTIDVRSVLMPTEGEEAAEETVVLEETDWDVTPDEENPMEPPGFDVELLGLKAGADKSFVLGWPEDGQSMYKGKQAQFTVRVKKVQAYAKPELNDDFAKLVGPDYETLEDLKRNIVESIEAGEKNRLENEFVTNTLDAIVDMSELSYPPVVIEDQIDSMLQDTEQRLRQLGIDSMETFLNQTKQKLEDYRERLRPDAIKIARRNLVLSEIVRTEQFTVTDAEIEAQIRRMVGIDESAVVADDETGNEAIAERSASAAALADMLRQGGGRTMLMSQLLTEKAIAFLVATARGEEPVRESQAVETPSESRETDETQVAEVQPGAATAES